MISAVQNSAQYKMLSTCMCSYLLFFNTLFKSKEDPPYVISGGDIPLIALIGLFQPHCLTCVTAASQKFATDYEHLHVYVGGRLVQRQGQLN